MRPPRLLPTHLVYEAEATVRQLRCRPRGRPNITRYTLVLLKRVDQSTRQRVTLALASPRPVVLVPGHRREQRIRPAMLQSMRGTSLLLNH